MTNETGKTLEITDVIEDVKFDAVYDEYKKLVMNTCLSVLNNKELAEDAFQSTFISVAQNIYKLKGTPDKVKKYIIKTARNVAIDKDLFRGGRFF